MWPFIQLFLIQVHVAPHFWRRLGIGTYLIILLEGLPLVYVIDLWQTPILHYQVLLPVSLFAVGVALVATGIGLHLWTAKLLGLRATIGYTELTSQNDPQDLIISGPFAVVRHPSYVAHTFIFTGIFLITGVIMVGIMAFADILISYFVTMELEERELRQRFGEPYHTYQRKVPKFFPNIRRHSDR